MANTKFPSMMKDLEHPDNPEAMATTINPGFMALALLMLTPEEIKQAAEEGREAHEQAMRKRIKVKES